jgi:hypothetical protein
MSLVVSTQFPLQIVVPPGHTQLPALHVSLLVHLIPQPPQLFGSCFSLTQALLQSDRPPGHCATQAPALHTEPAAQAMPQPPQLFGSVCSFTHAPLQSV